MDDRGDDRSASSQRITTMDLPTPFVQSALPIVPRYAGKVRDGYDLPVERHALAAADRISAFDCILGAIPYK